MSERGIVMSVENKHAIVMLPGGGFRRIPWSGGALRIGQEIELPAPRLNPFYRWMSVPAAAAVLGAVYLFGVAPAVNAAAVISVDINPSVNLEISGRGRVIAAVGLDAGGRRLLSQHSVDGLTPSAAVSLLMREAGQDGYLSAARDVVIGAVFANQPQSWFSEVPKAAAVVLERAHVHASVVTVSGISPSLLATMQKPQVSVGRYLLWDRSSKNTRQGLSVKEVRTMPVAWLLEHAQPKHKTTTKTHNTTSGTAPSTAMPAPPNLVLPSLPVDEQTIASIPALPAQGSDGHEISHNHGQGEGESSPTPPSGTPSGLPSVLLSPPSAPGSANHGQGKGHGDHGVGADHGHGSGYGTGNHQGQGHDHGGGGDHGQGGSQPGNGSQGGRESGTPVSIPPSIPVSSPTSVSVSLPGSSPPDSGDQNHHGHHHHGHPGGNGGDGQSSQDGGQPPSSSDH